MLEVAANLMQTSRAGLGLHPSVAAQLGEPPHFGKGRLSGVAALGHQGMIDHDVLGRVSPHQGDVRFLDFAALETLAQSPRRVARKSEQKHTAGAPIEPMHWVNPLTQGVSYQRHRERIVIGPAAMYGQPGRLVDRDELGVSIEKIDVRHRVWPTKSYGLLRV